MHPTLDAETLVALVHRVFSPGPDDHRLAILVDLPDTAVPDTPAWRERREMAFQWWTQLSKAPERANLDTVSLVVFRNTRANNADLPATAVIHEEGPPPNDMEEVAGNEVAFDRIFREYQIFLAPTQFSLTAPLKRAAAQYGFRAATMPGFSRAMIPALRLDYARIGARVDRLKTLLDDAVRCDITFGVDSERHLLSLDLRHRNAHASSGVFPRAGTAGNLPSGEAYIVPYEGEIDGDPSHSEGSLPVQFGDEVVLYAIEENVARSVVSDGPQAAAEARRLREEPAYGNLAELGLGVLGDFGLAPTGETLLDEKLGLHIAFGRSDHFGGIVGPSSFSSPERVVHIDRVYVASVQPRITILKAVLEMGHGEQCLLMENGVYRVSFDT